MDMVKLYCSGVSKTEDGVLIMFSYLVGDPITPVPSDPVFEQHLAIFDL